MHFSKKSSSKQLFHPEYFFLIWQMLSTLLLHILLSIFILYINNASRDILYNFVETEILQANVDKKKEKEGEKINYIANKRRNLNPTMIHLNLMFVMLCKI